MAKEKLLGKNLEELQEVALSLGLPRFTAGQMAQWLYQKRVRTIEAMTNLSKAAREKLSEKYEIGVTAPLKTLTSADGTKKYLFPVCEKGEESAVEAVMIPDGDRATLCVSSQSGCKMGCKFCMTGRQGFHGSLSAAEILSQFVSVDESESLTNAVFMGMGEPLDNYDNVMRAIEVLTAPWGFAWSPKRITVSTIGVLPALKRFLEESRCHIAVSLHNPFPPERLSIMPSQKAWSITEVVRLLEKYDFSGQRRVSFEYIMFNGFNDTLRHADALLHLLRHLECRVNLIRFHQIPDFPYTTSPAPVIEAFRRHLCDGGVTATLRASRGEDILAACGLLAGEHSKEKAPARENPSLQEKDTPKGE